MLENYLIIHKSILPEYYEKVLEARNLIESGQIRDVSAAVRKVGISRSTYYKYKDYILQPSELNTGRRAVLSVMLSHETGVLSSLLMKISDTGSSVLTITQSLPIHGVASVTISLDISHMNCRVEDLLTMLSETPGAQKTKLLAIE